ncbi:unnamed protein product [Effrenium voratum]|nr:unnamed protein product [Effrenium voratum]CAJ1429468.1 unnamed protein product [Effrenium voratum]
MLLDSVAPSPWWLFLSYSLISGLGLAMIFCPAATLLYGRLEGWQLPVAVGLASAGGGAGTIAVNSAMEVLLKLGWRSTQQILAGAYAVLLIPCCLVLRCLLKSEGTSQTNPKQPMGCDVKALLRPFLELKFMLFSVCVLLYIATSMIPFTHLVFYARDALDYENAAGLISVAGLGSILGRISSGVLATVIPASWIFAALVLLQGGVFFWLPFCETWQLTAFSMIYGVSSGVRVALLTLVVAELFGAQRVQALYCLLGLPMGLGLVAGPPLAGLVFDLTGSYQAAFLGSGAAMVALLPLLALLFRRDQRHVGSGERDDQSVADKSVGSPKSPLAELNFQSDSEGPQENSLA